MSNQALPEKLRRRFKVDTVEEMWQKIFAEDDVWHRHYRHLYGMLPSNPRCVGCFRPFTGIGGVLVRTVQGIERSTKNPRFCNACFLIASQFPGGAGSGRHAVCRCARPTRWPKDERRRIQPPDEPLLRSGDRVWYRPVRL
jgi:hypothetical protein